MSLKKRKSVERVFFYFYSKFILSSSNTPLHEALRMDRMDLDSKINSAIRRRKWLLSNQKLLRSFTSYCTLHSAQNYRLISALMELLLLLLEVRQDMGVVQHISGITIL